MYQFRMRIISLTTSDEGEEVVSNLIHKYYVNVRILLRMNDLLAFKIKTHFEFHKIIFIFISLWYIISIQKYC